MKAEKSAAPLLKHQLRHQSDGDMPWKIVKAASNDNPLPAFYWFKHLIPWSLLIGFFLAYCCL